MNFLKCFILLDNITLMIMNSHYVSFRLAILYALHSPELDVRAITTVHGNTTVEHCTRNLKTCLRVVEAHQRHAPSAMNGGGASTDNRNNNNIKDELEDPVSPLIPRKLFSKPVIAVGAANPRFGTNPFAEHVHGQNGSILRFSSLVLLSF